MNLSISITIIGLFILLLSIFLLPAKSITSPKELAALLPNQKILVQGKVIGEKYYKNYKILTLDNNLELKCDINCPQYLNKNISALTLLESYNNKNTLKTLRISSN